MTKLETNLELLLVSEDEGTPILKHGLPLESAGARPPERDGAKKKRSWGVDPNLVDKLGWGVVVPEGDRGQHLWDLIAPLRAERGGVAVRRFPAKPGLGRAEAAAWRDRLYAPADAGEPDPPRYLLILGDADEISWELQACLQAEAFVGRLAFPSDDGYRSYIDKLLGAEAEARRAPAARAMFYGARDGSDATNLGYEALVAPSLQACQKRNASRAFPAAAIGEVGGESSSVDDLLREAGKPGPTVLFTLSHGCGAPREGWKSRPADQRRALQGALVVEPGEYLTAAALGQKTFLPDGMWFFFACFGGGTPGASAYDPWLLELSAARGLVAPQNLARSSLPRPDEGPPFVAALPQAALANPRGPLAVIAHVDLAWTYSFQGPSGDRAAPFQRVVESLMWGRRAGVAYRELLQALSSADHDLADMYGSNDGAAGVDRLTRAELWMRRFDLASYVLLGDPAARLPIPWFDREGARFPALLERPAAPIPVIARPVIPIRSAPSEFSEASIEPKPEAIPATPRPAGARPARGASPDAAGSRRVLSSLDPVPIEVGVLWAALESLDDSLAACVEAGVLAAPSPAIDAIAVGHYAGVTSPSGSELALDVALSLALGTPAQPGKRPAGRDRPITTLARRDLLADRAGTSCYLPDPRRPGRIIAVAGMGRSNQFGSVDLALLVRELCWSLGNMGKKHLATLVIGSGAQSLHLDDAVRAWMRGVRTALTELEQSRRWQLARITFVERDPLRLEQITKVLREIKDREAARPADRPRLGITLVPAPPSSILARGDAITLQKDKQAWKDPYAAANRATAHAAPARILIEREGKRLRFGAVTETASVPERTIGVDPALIAEANARLARFQSTERQAEWARYMGRLIFPAEIAELLASTDPLLLMVDASTARIQWEMLVPPPVARIGEAQREPVGLVRGVSRQLRTAFAPPPEPPPPRRRVLRVLIVVSDPKSDLLMAQREGRSLEELFLAFNTVHQHPDYRVDVKLLADPKKITTRNDVLFELISGGPYDVLHYAGHCFYDRDDPHASGWIFENGSVLSVHELSRIERIPRFVFANACESGITPDRISEANLGLGPSFAESFFARGVADFVCTAWPVDDGPALDFAVDLYAGLLGLAVNRKDSGYTYTAATPLAMHEALLHARKGAGNDDQASSRHDVSAARTQTWGAYQHYGSPYRRFFDHENNFGGGQEGEPESEFLSTPLPAGSRVAPAIPEPPPASPPERPKHTLTGLPADLAARPVDGHTMVSDAGTPKAQ
jgi:CHAT domain